MKKLYTYYNFNESIRDLMKPISGKEMENAVIGQTSSSPLGYFNPFEWGFKLEDMIQDYIFDFIDPNGNKWVITIYDNMICFRTYVHNEINGLSKINDEYHFFTIETLEKFMGDMGYEKRVNESVRDLMTPKSKEDIVKALGLSLEEQLIRGLEKGEYWLVKQAIENGADIRYRDDTPLYCCNNI